MRLYNFRSRCSEVGAGAARWEQLQRGGSRCSEVEEGAARSEQVQRGGSRCHWGGSRCSEEKEQVQRGASRRREFGADSARKEPVQRGLVKNNKFWNFSVKCKISLTNLSPISLPYTFFLLKNTKILFHQWKSKFFVHTLLCFSEIRKMKLQYYDVTSPILQKNSENNGI